MNCPSCGAKIDIVPWIITYTCPYCNTISFFDKEELKNTWEKSEIIPFPTTFDYWKTYFAIKNKTSNDIINWKKVTYLSEEEFSKLSKKEFLAKFYVFWHIRYTTDTSFYDKFFLRILDDNLKLDRNKNLIVEEDEWQIKLYYIDKVEDKWFFDEMFKWPNISKDGYFIQEKWVQKIEWFVWWIPFDFVGVKENRYLNLVWSWGKNYLLENYNKGEILFAEWL